ncbi:MAG: glycosyl hydrolase family 28-related protein, partial [bacterium]
YGDQKVRIARGLKENIPDLDTGELGLATDTNELFIGNDGINLNIKEYVSVKDFGAKGDGETDDTKAFKDALSYIDNNGTSTLYIPNGEYNIYDTLNLNSETLIKGENFNSIINLKDNITLFELNGVNRCNISYLKIVGENNDGEVGIDLNSSATRFSASNIYFDNVYNSINSSSSWILHFEKILIQNGTIGFDFNSQSNAITILSSVVNSNNSGIEINNSEGITIINTAFHHNIRAVEISNRTWGVTILGSYFEDNEDKNILISGGNNQDEWNKGIKIIGNFIKEISNPSKTNCRVYIRKSSGIDISGNNFSDSIDEENDEPAYILIYDPEGTSDGTGDKEVTNISIYSNHFDNQDQNQIAWSQYWDNNNSFPGEIIEQPFGISGTNFNLKDLSNNKIQILNRMGENAGTITLD